MTRIIYLLFIISAISFFACNNKNDTGNTGNPENLYFDYKITGEEGNDTLTILLQYREGGTEGDAISIGEIGKVELDGEVVPSDSTKMSGTYYEIHKPKAALAGKHNIVFTNSNNKEYREEFNFQPFTLRTKVADTIQRNKLVLDFDGLDPEDHVKVLMTDTSFVNDGISRELIVHKGQLVITKTDLENLSNGPVQLEIIKEQERQLKNGTKEGGKILIIYSLKREFFLRD